MGKNINKVTFASLLIALGIIYGDIGTSPLYVLKAITSNRVISEELIIGALSCVIWTLTLQTTFEYVIFVLRADNKGEGGIFSLYTLVRRQRKWLIFPAMIGGAALLADGIITPPISVMSAVEGLRTIPGLEQTTQTTIIIIVISILIVLFFFQQFGTASIGKIFGPIMLLWFSMLAILGILHISDDWEILKAFNPYYAVQLLTHYPGGFWLLGAVFLCTTGAEALYSDLGHCGRDNIRYSWIFVKTCLIINYMGQGAWILHNYQGQLIDEHFVNTTSFHPFYGVMPEWFRIPGTIIASAAAIIASQALISGSFTLIGEAMRLNVWPKMKIKFPTEEKGQVFISGINTLLFLGCCFIVLYFQNSSNMEATYGLTITICMTATTILFSNFLITQRVYPFFIYIYLFIFLSINMGFLVANLDKFTHGGYVTLLTGGLLYSIMYIWFRSRKIKNRYVEFVRLENYIPQIQELSSDRTIPKYATHLVYLTSANNPKEIEHKIIYSILNKKPKRADIYWFVHIDTVDNPYTCEYKVDHIIPNDIIRIDFRLGFRVEPRINLMFRKVIEELVANKEVNIF
ncbi:MAG: KUP/HAK/KT family potassium transporter, partial [Chitinophagaceae bacterium]